MANRITVHAIDKDSSSSFSRSFDLNENFKKAYKEFEKDVPFSRWYPDFETDEDTTKAENTILIQVGLI